MLQPSNGRKHSRLEAKVLEENQNCDRRGDFKKTQMIKEKGCENVNKSTRTHPLKSPRNFLALRQRSKIRDANNNQPPNMDNSCCESPFSRTMEHSKTGTQRNLDIFAWKPADMTGVSRHIAEHRLNVREGCSPIRQKKRGQTPERNKAIQEEMEKLVDVDIMKEVHYHSWLSNPVMVKKHDDSWRMCVDFKDLNKACPKDGYPLPEIDWKVESLCGYSFKCFLDVYKGYHQIKMTKEDEEKKAFITSQGIFCYSKMPFGLKNAGATYQRLVDKAFQKQIGRNLEVYVDDLVIKSCTEHEIIRDIEETFKTLREINMKLNPKKCTFGIEEGTFLGYKVNTKGIKIPLQISREVSAILQNLEKCTKKSDFQWTAEAEVAFKQMKQLIAELPTLTAPMKKEELIVYLAAAREAVSAVLMMEREAKQMPVYFVSRTLQVERLEDDLPDTLMEAEEELLDLWILFTDGSSCVGGTSGLVDTVYALDKGKFKAPPPMTTPVEKRNNNKFCEFHGEVRHNIDECMHLRREIEELIKNGKLSHVINELKQGSGKDQPKTANKGETLGKDKPLAILMVKPWQRV
ncbi:reverse transcriptase domain-containing protein, partial [Tanacetum coccineum]